MKRIMLTLITVAAMVTTVLFGFNATAVSSTTSEPVPTCTKPSGSFKDAGALDKLANYQACLQARTEALLANLQPATSPEPAPEPQATSPEPAPQTTSPEPATSPTPDPTEPPTAADFPTRQSVGPATDPTKTYQGSCTVTTDDLVIENVIVNCQETGLVIGRNTTGVVIRNAIVNGGVFTSFSTGDAETDDDTHPLVFTIDSSRVYSGPGSVDGRAIGFAHFEVRNSYVEGAHSGIWAANKTVLENNYITTDGTDTHQSGLRMLKNSTLRGNTVFCNPTGTDQDGGCSADAVFYREFGVPGNLTIEGNYFPRNPTGGGQWFATRFVDCNQTNDCTNLKVTGNLFGLNQGTDGGEFPTDAGDVWTNNWWTDGAPALSGQVR